MAEPHRRTTTVACEDHPRTAPGPGSDPARVFEAYENEGHAHPGAAWASFTADWNWAATLPHAVAESGPDRAMAGAAARRSRGSGPAGFAAHSSGAALPTQDIGFLWTAVAGMALGAASRLADELAVLGPSVAPPFFSPAATAAELSTLLRQERLGFTAEPYNRPGLGRLISLAARQSLANRVRRAAMLVHHVVTAAYEKAIPFPAKDGQHPLESLVVDSTAVLQHLRFTVDLLPIEDVGSATGRCT